MLQVAFGGYYLIDSATYQYYDSPVYYEPGFNLLTPLELQVPKSDRVVVLIRKRDDDTGTSFTPLDLNNLEMECKDVTTGEEVPNVIYNNNYYAAWDTDSSLYSPLVAFIDNAIDLTASLVRVRTVDVVLRDKTDNDFIQFRLNITESGKYFHYIFVHTKDLTDRYAYSAVGNTVYVKLKLIGDSYLLFSPYAFLKEVSSDEDYDFSYPIDTIHYQRQRTYNNEEFSFEVVSSSHTFVENCISVTNVPGYSKVGLLLIDQYMYSELKALDDKANVVIRATGETSGYQEDFTVYFMR